MSLHTQRNAIRTIPLWKSTALLFLAFASNAAAAAAGSIAEKDLAIAMPHTFTSLLKASSRLADQQTLFPRAWYQAVDQAYRTTSIGSAFSDESPYEDWQLVSLRVAPCEALGLSPRHDVERLCWPEVRLVWQGIEREVIVNSRPLLATASDRAIHAIYPVDPQLGLATDEADRAEALLKKIHDATLGPVSSSFQPLSSSELSEFVDLRNRVVGKMLDAALALRSPRLAPATFGKLGLRPEFTDLRAEENPFMGRLTSFLSAYARPQNLRKMTSFSLPEGQDPAGSDEWIFVAFSASAAQITREAITLHSPVDGRKLGPSQLTQRGSMRRDEDSFYEWPNLSEINEVLMMFNEDTARLTPLLSDKRKILVPNTSCVSCHKMNELRFDFHNFSYLQEQEITISPRVVRDVAVDLQWIKSHL